MKSKIATVALLSALLSSCVTAEQATQMYGAQTPASPVIRAAIVEHVRNTFFDPYSIRDAEISNQLRLSSLGVDVVCFKANAKNRMGGYIGRKAVSVRIKDGKVNSWVEEATGCSDPRLKYEPFPQLENL
ncbi:hypothetical protein DSM25558_0180 [Agrobacterium sp. DSM 25558]|uniref:hypothetical protein n=1 Tax=Agrobacterium sp. DSM 25558 TaxID=1907665 RepID=UPI00097240FF|nr:hypothetical protein [Agrobacterium sp. DSM 25558]SCX00802.1 hypothetical protein DSM25558_0180 [Agrobacterium sp. DSM 25558]